MLGLGTLTLPSAFARLGWVLALALVALCAAGTLYSGRLFTMLTLKVAQLAGTGCRNSRSLPGLAKTALYRRPLHTHALLLVHEESLVLNGSAVVEERSPSQAAARGLGVPRRRCRAHKSLTTLAAWRWAAWAAGWCTAQSTSPYSPSRSSST